MSETSGLVSSSQDLGVCKRQRETETHRERVRERHRERAREICVWARYLVWPEVERGQVQGASVGGLPVHGHHVAIVIAQGVPDSGPQRERETVKTGVNQSASFPLSSHRRHGVGTGGGVFSPAAHSLTHSRTHRSPPSVRALTCNVIVPH